MRPQTNITDLLIKKGMIHSNQTQNFDYQLTILPNPSSVSSTILFSLPNDVNNVNIVLYDAYQNAGQQLQTIPADRNTNSANVNTTNISTGIYIVYLQVDGIGVASEQLLVIH